MHATSRIVIGSTPTARLRAALRDLDTESLARRLADELRETPSGRLCGDYRGPCSREQVIRSGAELIRVWLTCGRRPAGDALSELYETARVAAGHGLPLGEVVRAGCATMRAVAAALLESVPAADHGWLVPQLEALWAFPELAAETIVRAYRDQRDLPSAADNSRAAILFARICEQSPPSIEDLDRAERLGYPLAGPHHPFVAAIDGGRIAAYAGLAARLRAAGALACAEGHRVSGLTAPGFDWGAFLADGALILAAHPAASRSGLAETVDNLHDLVTLAAKAGRRGRVRPEDFLTEVMLANSPQLAEHALHRVLGQLDAEDPAGTLAATLRCLAAHGFDRSAAAAALPAHRNTLLYRINRIEKLSGLDLDRHAHRELVRLAFVWQETTACDR